jgi:hypothetical protein
MYNQITEGRESSPGHYYGWCGDYVTYCLMVAGCRDPFLINRKAIRGSWAPGRNIADLLDGARKYGALTSYANPGDIFICEAPKGDHVAIVRNCQPSWQLLNGNGWNGVVSLGNICSRVKAAIDVDKLPSSDTRPISEDYKTHKTGGGNGMPMQEWQPLFGS